MPAALSQIETRSESLFDGAGRETAKLLRSFGAEIRRTSTVYQGDDRVDVTPPSGGIPTSTFTDAWGQVTRKTEWMGAIDGAGVEQVSLQYQYNGRGQMTGMTDDDGNAWTWTFDQRGRQTATADPDAGAKTYTYDDLGWLQTTTDARGITLGYTYDALGRRTTERSGGTTGTVLASWAYDSLTKGQLTSSSRFSGGLEYKTRITGYDNAYRPTGSTVSIPTGAPAFAGTTYTTSTYYNADGSVAATVVPAAAGLPGEELYPSYDGFGRQTGLSGAAGYASGIVYTAASELGQIVRPGTTWSALTFGYDAGTRQLASLDETTRRGGTTFTQEALRKYTRNAAGIITKVATTSDGQPSDTQCFRYDGLQALTDAWTPSSGDCSTGPTATLGGAASYRGAFTVDPDTGNRTSATTWSGQVATVSSYGYPAAGGPRPHGVSSVTRTTGTGSPTVASYGYDAAGGMTARDGQTLTYDEAGRLATVVAGSVTEKSLYTADGTLLLRWGGADGASLFLGDTVLRDKGGVKTGIRTYTAAGIQVAERVSGTGGGLFWLSPDPVGTVGLEINVATGAVTRRFMDPFGNTRGTATAWSSLFGYLNAPASSTGLTQLGARAYDAGLGKFVSVDPLLDTGEPRHANAYTYAYHSPLSYSDPTGLLSNRMMIDDGKYAPKATTKTGTVKPPAAGSGGGGSAPKAQPKQQPQWWNPTTWGADTWKAIGTIAVGVAAVAATVAIGACVVATAGICAAVGLAIGAVAMATVGATAAAVTYQLSDGPKTAEGAFLAQLNGAAGGAAGGIAGAALAPAASAVSKGIAALSPKAGAASSAAAGAIEAVQPNVAQGYGSFGAAKRALGSPGPGNVYDHVVEQSQIARSGFAPQMIHNPVNMKPVPAQVNQIKANYYSRKFDWTNGGTVRDWLTGQPYGVQHEFGLRVLEDILVGAIR
ncbi:RHS repeat-associated core domain-containing protein [Microbacterium kyungheense]|uniref:RHS repeat-associated core domain-containing protein n=1 Tax=Microbacterium kyungheense TaxID=1263636 RepID=UPI0011508638|nr:RHS repeat-associated core domain-containing protein [Microbacterium kyungheense]